MNSKEKELEIKRLMNTISTLNEKIKKAGSDTIKEFLISDLNDKEIKLFDLKDRI